MKKYLIATLMCFSALFSYADSYHFYTNFKANGDLEKYESIFDRYIVTIDEVGKSSNHYVTVTVTIKLTVPVEEEYLEIYRCHADGTHHANDVNDPIWNMKLQPSINPEWCSYSYTLNEEGKVTQFTFKDTFHENLLKSENPNCNSIHYLIYDRHEDTPHDIMIRITNILYYDIVTSVGSVFENIPVEYYDLEGHKLNKPIRGIMIKKQGNEVTKVLVK